MFIVKKFLKKWKYFMKKIKRLLLSELNSKICFTKTNEEAMDILNKKKNNKIILITNGNNGGKEFILEARKIIGSNTIMGVSAYAISKHI